MLSTKTSYAPIYWTPPSSFWSYHQLPMNSDCPIYPCHQTTLLFARASLEKHHNSLTMFLGHRKTTVISGYLYLHIEYHYSTNDDLTRRHLNITIYSITDIETNLYLTWKILKCTSMGVWNTLWIIYWSWNSTLIWAIELQLFTTLSIEIV